MNKLIISSSPHLRSDDSTGGIMLDVCFALLPAAIAGIAIFGPRAAAVLGVCIIFAVLSEAVWEWIFKKPISVMDGSAVVTGLLLGMNLPSRIPLWMAALGSIIAIIVVKQMFGGLGQNFANPAITARIVLMVSFPAAMTTYSEPFGWYSKIDALSSATPLTAGPDDFTYRELLLGLSGGCIGEVCALLLLAGGAYLVFRRVITSTIPLSFIGTVAICSLCAGADPIKAILSGGLLLGAIFMATDYVTSPYTFLGKLIFGIGCGLITFAIRQFGNLPEGVSFSILLMNLLVPHINRITRPRPFGSEGAK